MIEERREGEGRGETSVEYTKGVDTGLQTHNRIASLVSPQPSQPSP
jgi:hypothetical protein